MAAVQAAVGSNMVLHNVGGWTFGFVDNDGQREQPRARDLDIAKRLGYKRPRKIRDLIARLRDAGKLNDVHRRPEVGRRGFVEEIIDEYWLTEAQALKVAAKSETDAADALLDEMIHVYTLARAGRLTPQDWILPEYAQRRIVDVQAVADRAKAEFDVKELAFAAERARLLSGQRSTICDAEFDEVRGLIAEIVDLWLALGRADTKRAALQLVKHRAIPGAFSKGFRLRFLPREQVPGVLRALEVLRSDAETEVWRLGALPKKKPAAHPLLNLRK